MRFPVRCVSYLLLTVGSTSAALSQEPYEPTIQHVASTLDLLKEEAIDTIRLDRAVHFTTPDLKDTIASPETYQVSATGGNRLQLSEVKRQHRLIIDALVSTHSEVTTTPIALYIEDDEKFPHVILLLPGGKALEAVGSYNGVRSRAGGRVPLTVVQIQKALNKKLKR